MKIVEEICQFTNLMLRKSPMFLFFYQYHCEILTLSCHSLLGEAETILGFTLTVLESVFGLYDVILISRLMDVTAAASVTLLLHSPLINCQEGNKPRDLQALYKSIFTNNGLC